MNILMILTSDDGETLYNAMRLANIYMKKEHEVSVFMLGRSVIYEQCGSEQFNVLEEVNKFEGDFYV